MNTEPQIGYCPKCSRILSSLTVGAKGFCEYHGWQYANWSAVHDIPDDDLYEPGAASGTRLEEK